MTISASYGAGGSVVGPALAELLGFPFLDRAVAARDTAPPGAESATQEEHTDGVLTRLFARYSTVPDPVMAGVASAAVVVTDDAVREEGRARVQEFAQQDSVILGWGGTVLVPHAFHVRLDGPLARRVLQGMRIEQLDEPTARSRLARTDKVRSAFMKRLYGRDWRDPELYHLVVDSTAIDLADSARLIGEAAGAFWG